MKRRSIALALIAVSGPLAAGLLSASAVGVSILTPRSFELQGQVTPSKLPRAMPRPITLTLEGKISEPGSDVRPPAMKTLALQFDKGGAIFTKGLPTCKWSPTIDVSIIQACGKALIGHGEVEIEVEVPEQPAFHTEAPMEIFNGPPQDGHPVLIYEAYLHLPAPTTDIVSGVIRRDSGKFGTQTTIQIPTFVGGYGSLTDFQAKIGKTWNYKGKKASLITAHCQAGSLLAHEEIEYVSGNTQSGDLTQPCTPADPPPAHSSTT